MYVSAMPRCGMDPERVWDTSETRAGRIWDMCKRYLGAELYRVSSQLLVSVLFIKVPTKTKNFNLFCVLFLVMHLYRMIIKLEWLKNKIFKQGIGIAEKSLETRMDRWGGNVNPKSLF